MSIKLHSIAIFLVASVFMLLALTPTASAWGGSTHTWMTGSMATCVPIGNPYYTILTQNAPVPDYSYFGQYGPYDHAYFPTNGYGGAAIWARQYTNTAKYWYQNGRQDLAFQYLGWATHYTEDVSNFAHTTTLGIVLHNAYESYVDNNWVSGQYYCQSCSNGAVISSDPGNLVVYSASNANSKTYLFTAIMALPGWETNPSLISGTKDNIHYGSACTNGLYWNMRGWV